MKRLLLLALLCLCAFTSRASVIDSLSVRSKKMDKNIPVKVITPDGAQGKRLPVLYLLHGCGNNENAWIEFSDIEGLVDQYDIIVVCPYGEKSWYWDSPINPDSQFETFVSIELPKYIDKHYMTYKTRKARAVAGFSMGGHGAMWNALRHKDVFGAVCAISAGVDIRPFPEEFQMNLQLGPMAENQQRWEEHTVINLINSDNLKDGELAISIDCGKDDFFMEVNQTLHAQLDSINVGHDFTTRPGSHNWIYWNTSIEHQMLYVYNYFKANNKGFEK